jgi:hypothetical protein
MAAVKTMRMGDREIEYVEVVTDYDEAELRAAAGMGGMVQAVDLDGEVIWTSPEMARAVHDAYEQSVAEMEEAF